MKMPISVPIASAEAIEKFVIFLLKFVILVVALCVFAYGVYGMNSADNFISVICNFVWVAAGISLAILFAVISCK